MARKIDFSKPLSEDEKAYVLDRPWLLEDAKLRGEDIIDEDDFTVAIDDATPDPEFEQPGQVGVTIGVEDEAEAETDEDDEVAPYSEWEYADLQNEAKERDLSAKGSKEQLIQRLEEHDAAQPTE